MTSQGDFVKSETRGFVESVAMRVWNVIISIAVVMLLSALICLIFYPCVLYVIALCTMILCRLVIGLLWKLVLKILIYWIGRGTGRS